MLKSSGKVKFIALLRSKIGGSEKYVTSYDVRRKSSTAITTSLFGTSAFLDRPARRKLTLISLDWTR
eukprot:CCRYP_017155-RA/>CCRYP_017155-RA protein AED:0.42 eAED:0.42 QI:33/1/0.5/1/1/0.5/2/0/66